MPRRFLVLHGLGNRRPPEHWQHWLVDRLRDRGEQVLYPQLPVPDAPRFDDWRELLDAELALLGSGERVVVCHSLSCALWLGAGRVADRVLLVAPPSGRVLARVAPSFAAARPFARAAAGSPTTIVCSSADPYNPENEQPALAARLNAELRQVPGGGHLAVDDGFGPWPAVEGWCVEGDARF